VRVVTGGLLPALVVFTATAAGAAAPPSTPAASKRTPPKTEEVLPAANVTLTIEASTPRGPWKMRVTNDGDVPVTLAADARLLALDVTPRSARKSEHCELPAEMRPQDDLGRPLVLPPHRSYAERFEPRLYCIDGARLEALAPGAIVTATLGWSGKGTRPPLVISPIEGVEPRVAPAKAIKSAAIALPDEPTPSPVPHRDEGMAGTHTETNLALETGRSVDAPSVSEIVIPVTLANKGSRAVIMRFRPETLAFDVIGPQGATHCGWPVLLSPPSRDVFTTLGAGASTSLTVVLSAYCNVKALTLPGLYVVRGSLDTRSASDAEIGIRSFDGQVIATSPTLVRLRRGTATEPLVRPTLERAPTAPTPSR
jgi:hypothetical protein